MSERLIPLMLSVSKETRDQLRVMAAQENLKDPDIVTSAAEIARAILINYLKTFKSPNLDSKVESKDKDHENPRNGF